MIRGAWYTIRDLFEELVQGLVILAVVGPVMLYFLIAFSPGELSPEGKRFTLWLAAYIDCLIFVLPTLCEVSTPQQPPLKPKVRASLQRARKVALWRRNRVRSRMFLHQLRLEANRKRCFD